MSRRRLGLTLIELVLSAALLGILATALAPVSQVASRRRAELELKQALRTMRLAIDRFVEDRARRETTRPRPQLYPRDLDELVRARYLRRVPRDPMTRKTDWRTIGTAAPPDPGDLSLVSSSDQTEFGETARTEVTAESRRVADGEAPASHNGGLFDVRSTSAKTALDGTTYKEW